MSEEQDQLYQIRDKSRKYLGSLKHIRSHEIDDIASELAKIGYYSLHEAKKAVKRRRRKIIIGRTKSPKPRKRLDAEGTIPVSRFPGPLAKNMEPISGGGRKSSPLLGWTTVFDSDLI